LRDDRHRSGRKTLAQRAKSGDLEVKRQATWGMSVDTFMERPDEPVEILRTLHSFDPCLACSTHVMSPDGQEMARVKVR
jgi:Ni,Fe-hydrogenase I large subunit